MEIIWWEKRTELEKCLLLVIIVTIPTIFLYIGLFLHYSAMKNSIDTTMLNLLNDITGGNYFMPSPNSISKRYVDSCKCPNINCTKKLEPNKFIISISEKLYEDDPNEYKFKCLAMLLSSSYILTFKNCLSKNMSLNIRSSSDYWSTGGYTRRISHYNNMKNISVIAKLSEPLPDNGKFIKVMALNPHELSNATKLDVYRWKSKFHSTLKRRSKYDKLIQIQLITTKCTNKSNNFYVFCAQEHMEFYSNEDVYDRDPVFLADSNMLIGMEIQRLIFNNTVEHYYQLIKKNI